MALQLRLKVRDWDFWTPLLLGDVKSEKLDIQTTRVSSLIDNVAEDPEADAAEMSLSRYNLRIDQNKAQGIVAVPFFIMRGFRTRNIVTTNGSPPLDVILTFATPSTFHGVAKHAIFAGVQRQRRSAPAEQGAQHL